MICSVLQSFTESKKLLRNQMKNIRKSMDISFKESCDNEIFLKLVSSEQFRNHDKILCYVSTDIEVDTRRFINYALECGKTVAVPKCGRNGEMTFFEIDSLDNLERSAFGIDEPSEKLHRKFSSDETDSCLCIVPALAFDSDGMRLGYGGGYYDRFLSRFSPETVGICYSSCIVEKIPSQQHDIRIKNIITETGG